MNIGLCGDPGSGKTSGLVFFTWLFLELEKRKGYGNFAIHHPNFEQVDILKIIELMREAENNPNNSPMYHAVLSLTEVYTLLESRISTSSKLNLIISYLIFQARKLGIHILWDAQLVSSVELRLRELTELRFMCQKESNGFRYTVLDRNFPAENVPTNRCLFISFDTMRFFWSKYESYKITEPIGMRNLFFEMEENDPARLRVTVDRQVRLLRDSNVRVRTLAQTKVALLRLGEPVCFADLVNAALTMPS